MKEIILTVFAVLTAITLQAQIISGYVKDALSGETLAGATIVNESDEGSTTVTGNDQYNKNGNNPTIKSETIVQQKRKQSYNGKTE